MKIKHNKTKNIGLLFEVMANEIVRLAACNDKNTQSVIAVFKDTLNKYPILLKEYQIYKNISKNSFCTSETQAYRAIDSIYNSARLINENQLNKAVNELYSNLNKFISVKKMFSNKVNNYKLYASVQTLINEARYPSGVDFMNVKNLVESSIAKHIMGENSVKSEKVMNEDLNIDSLTYNILIRKFNKKYDLICEGQKNLVRDYIIYIDDKEKMNSVLKENINYIVSEIDKNNNSNDKSFLTKTRLLKEKIKSISDKKNIVNNSNIEFILECHNFVDNLQKWKGIS